MLLKRNKIVSVVVAVVAYFSQRLLYLEYRVQSNSLENVKWKKKENEKKWVKWAFLLMSIAFIDINIICSE